MVLSDNVLVLSDDVFLLSDGVLALPAASGRAPSPPVPRSLADAAATVVKTLRMSVTVLRDDAAVPVGGVSVAVLAWRFHGALRVTAIAKATFAFALDAPMVPIPPQPVIRAEVHHGKSPARSVRLTTDLAPYLNHADVLLTGHAHAPRGEVVEVLPVRFGIFDGQRAVLDKTVNVRQRGGVRQVPLVYERAYGGAGWADNPLGVGADGSGEPSVIDPADERRRAGFGPIGQAWPERERLLGRLDRRALEGPGVIDLPDDLDWECFQAAPADQRVPFLRGDEWLLMEGMHPRHARYRVSLPGARGLGLVYGLGPWGVAEGQLLALHADTLRIDADEEHCTITFRGTFPVANEAALSAVRVVMGVETPGKPVRWPVPAPATPARAESPESAEMAISSRDIELAEGNVLDGTMRFEEPPEGGDGSAVLLEDATLATIPSRGTAPLESTMWSEPDPRAASALPFQGSATSHSPLRQPSAPQPRGYADVRLGEGGGTMMALPEEEVNAAQRSVLPFQDSGVLAAPAPPAPPPPAEPPSQRLPRPLPPPRPPPPSRATPPAQPPMAPPVMQAIAPPVMQPVAPPAPPQAAPSFDPVRAERALEPAAAPRPPARPDPRPVPVQAAATGGMTYGAHFLAAMELVPTGDDSRQADERRGRGVPRGSRALPRG